MYALCNCSGPYCAYRDTTYAVLFTAMVTVNYWNLIRIVPVIFEKIATFSGSVWRAGIFVYTRHQRMTDKHLKHWKWIKFIQPLRRYLHTCIKTDDVKNTVFLCWGRRCAYRSKPRNRSPTQYTFMVRFINHGCWKPVNIVTKFLKSGIEESLPRKRIVRVCMTTDSHFLGNELWDGCCYPTARRISVTTSTKSRLDDSEKTQPFHKVFSSEFAKNCRKGMIEAVWEENLRQ
jgi:hypothetical protein